MEISMGEITKLGKSLELPLFGVGFLYGSTKKFAEYNVKKDYTLAWRLSDCIRTTTGFKVKIGNYESGASPGPIIDPAGALNKGAAIALGAWLYKEIGGPYANQIAAFAIPIGTGYAIGGIFDPEYPANLGTTNEKSGGWWNQ